VHAEWLEVGRVESSLPFASEDAGMVVAAGVGRAAALGVAEVVWPVHVGDDLDAMLRESERGRLARRLAGLDLDGPPPALRLPLLDLTDDQIADLADWLTDRSYPLGLVCVDDEHAWRAVEAATMAGLRVPEDVAILGVGNDECLCDSCVPTISSVALDHEQVGHEAAALLASLIEGDADPGPRHIQPIGVIERGSTSVLAIDDPLVAQAMALIRDPEQGRWTINELADALHTSPRTLYRRFINVLGHPPGVEIRRARIESARWWITHTDLKLVVIADRVGFPSISQLSRDVQREFGVRPSELRRRYQASTH